MDKRNYRILLVEDDPGDAFFIEEMLDEASDRAMVFQLTHVQRLSEGLDAIAANPPDIVVSDLGLPDSRGLETLNALLQAAETLPIIVLSGLAQEDLALVAVEAGAQDYLIKGRVDADLLRRTIIHSIARKKIEEELKQRNNELAAMYALSSAISATLDLDVLIPSVLQTIIELDLLATKRKAALFLLEDGRFVPAHSVGYPESEFVRSMQLRFASHFCALGMREGRPVIISGKNDVFCAGIPADCTKHIAIPLTSKKQLRGVLCLGVSSEIVIDEHQMCLFLSLGNQLGVALENAGLYEETRRLSLHDPLTNLANRRMLDIHLEKSVSVAERYNHSFAVIMADIDYFKHYNDTKGHAAGDEILKKMATTIARQLRGTDLVARYGGEEFCMLLAETDLETAREVAERIRVVVRDTLGVSLSLGVAEYRKGLSGKKLVDQADKALYTAKKQGRNQVSLYTEGIRNTSIRFSPACS